MLKILFNISQICKQVLLPRDCVDINLAIYYYYYVFLSSFSSFFLLLLAFRAGFRFGAICDENDNLFDLRFFLR